MPVYGAVGADQVAIAIVVVFIQVVAINSLHSMTKSGIIPPQTKARFCFITTPTKTPKPKSVVKK
jgi:hypothetical protein